MEQLICRVVITVYCSEEDGEAREVGEILILVAFLLFLQNILNIQFSSKNIWGKKIREFYIVQNLKVTKEYSWERVFLSTPIPHPPVSCPEATNVVSLLILPELISESFSFFLSHK